MSTIDDIIKKLPPELLREVQDFAVFLLEKRTRHPRRKPRFDWAETAEDLRDQYTSVELQHRISEWRIGVG